MTQVRHLLLITILSAVNPGYADQQQYPFKLIKQPEAGRQFVMAQNKGPAPILLNLSFTADNAIVEPTTAIVGVIKPTETMVAASISIKTPGQGHRVGSSY